MLLYNIINKRSGGVVLNYIKYKANKYTIIIKHLQHGDSQQSISLESQISVQLKLT